MKSSLQFVGFVASGHTNGGGAVTEGPVRGSYVEAYNDAEHLYDNEAYGDKVKGVRPHFDKPDLLNLSIAEAQSAMGGEGLSLRTCHLIAKMFGGDLSKVTLRALLEKGEEGWGKTPGFGTKARNELKEWLHAL